MPIWSPRRHIPTQKIPKCPPRASGAKFSIVLGSLKFSDNAVFSIYSGVQWTAPSKLGTKAGLQRAINQFAQERKAETAKNDTGKYFQYKFFFVEAVGRHVTNPGHLV